MLQKKNLQHSLYENIPSKENASIIHSINKMNGIIRNSNFIPEYPSESNNNSIGLYDRETNESPYELKEYYWHENMPPKIEPNLSAEEELKEIVEAAKYQNPPYNFYKKGDGPKKIKTTHEREYSRLPMFVNNPNFKHKIISDDDMEPITISTDNPNSSKFYQFDSKPKNNMSTYISLLSQKV